MFHSDCNPESELSVLSDLDWQNYSESVPYEVIFDSNEGRYLRATRDIKRGMFLWKKNNVKDFFQAVYFIVKIKMNNLATLSQAKR